MLLWITDVWRRYRRRRSQALFRFFDGQRTRAVDPLHCWRALDQHAEFSWDMADEIEAGEPQATEICLKAIAEVFGLKRYDANSGGGLTEAEILNLFGEFGAWMEGSKKKQSHGWTTFWRMGGTSSDSPEVHPSTTSFSSGSSSGSTEPSHDAPHVSSVASGNPT